MGNNCTFKSSKTQPITNEKIKKKSEIITKNNTETKFNKIKYILDKDKDKYINQTNTMINYEIKQCELTDNLQKYYSKSDSCVYYNIEEVENYIKRNPRKFSKKNTISKKECKYYYCLKDDEIINIPHNKEGVRYYFKISDVKQFIINRDGNLDVYHNRIKQLNEEKKHKKEMAQRRIERERDRDMKYKNSSGTGGTGGMVGMGGMVGLALGLAALN